jgi:quinone-modifying oxidoreductase, subunit QmoB
MKKPNLDSRDLACDVVVIGDGRAADSISGQLKQNAIRVIRIPSMSRQRHPAPGDHILNAGLFRCDGFTGAYRIDVTDQKQAWRIRSAAIVVALDERRLPEYDAYGLAAGKRVHAISDAEALLNRGDLAEPDETVVMLNGLARESHPAISGRMVDLCIRLQQQHSGIKTIFITDNLKVAARGLDAACYEARRRGTYFYKLEGRRPHIRTTAQGRVQLSLFDPSIRNPMEIVADRVIVDEQIVPDERITQIALILGLRTDASGFGQEDNVRRLTHLTNRRGIFVAGATRGVLSDEERLADCETLSAAVNAFLKGTDRSQLPEVHIDTGLCGHCLTCHRTCPYMAIKIGDRMEVVPEACQACGLCVAACPAKAIKMQGGELAAPIWFESAGQVLHPRIVAFCCRRSAGLAFEAAVSANKPLPHVLIRVQVPCGGRIGTNDIAAAFETDADGVMVMTCHDDNCQAHTGSRKVKKRVEAIRNELFAAGIEPERILFSSIAANMGSEIARLSAEFEARLRTLTMPPPPAEKKE